jgi:hypothetical protein
MGLDTDLFYATSRNKGEGSASLGMMEGRIRICSFFVWKDRDAAAGKKRVLYILMGEKQNARRASEKI